MKKKLLIVFLLTACSFVNKINAQLFYQDFNASAVTNTTTNAAVTNTDYYTSTGAANKFDSIHVAGNASNYISINSGTASNLQVTDASTSFTWMFARSSNLAATAPEAVKITFRALFDVNGTGSTNPRFIFQIGSGFSKNYSGTNMAMKEVDANVFAGFGLKAQHSTNGPTLFQNNGSTQIGATNIAEATNTWTIVINNTGASLTYTDPNSASETVADNTFDLWIGTTKWGNDIAATTGTQTLNNFKFGSFTSGSSGRINELIDWIQIDDLTCFAPSISAHPSLTTQNICINGTPTDLSVSATASGTLTYQWYSNTTQSNSGGTLMSGYTSATLTPPTNVANTRYYYCEVKNNCGSGVINVINTSASGDINVSPASVGGSVAGSATVCTGTNSGTLTLSGHTGSITKWQSSTVSDFSSSVSDITNVTATQSYTNLSATTYYRAVITSGACTATNSGIATITMTTPPDVSNFSTSATGGCANTFSTVTITSSSLTSGLAYTVNYDLSGTNTGTGLTASVTLTAGSGTFNTGNLATPGATTITINSIAEGNCVSTVSSGNSANFTVLTAPTITLGTMPTVCYLASSQTANVPYSATTDNPTTYSISGWSGGSFSNVTNAALTAAPSNIVVTVPAATIGGAYTANLTVTGTCTSVTYVITITVNQVTVTPTSQTVAVGATTMSLPVTYGGTPNQYSIDYDATANFAGFTDVTLTTFSGSPITPLTIPALGGATHNATITLRNSTTGCSSPATAFTVTYATPAASYFQSRQNGNWSTAANWESSTDNATWYTATVAPTNAAISAIVRNTDTITVDANLSAPPIVVNNGGELTSAGFTIIPNSSNTITVNGKLSVTATTKVLTTTTNNLIFGATGIFYLNANGGYLPPADWSATSTAYFYGWTSATALTADDGSVTSATKLVGQPKVRYGNLVFDFPTSASGTPKVLQGFAANVSLTINGNLTLLCTNNRQIQLLTSSGANGLTAETINVNCGSWLINNSGYAVTANKDFRMVDSLSSRGAGGGYYVAALSFGSTGSNNLNVKGDFVHTIGAITSGNATAQSINFTGAAAQNATFNTLTNEVDININNTAGVTLLNNLSMGGTLTLTAGVFTVGNNSLTFYTNAVPIIRNGTTSVGTLTMSATSSLTFGTPGNTGGGAFTIPNNCFTSGPAIGNFTVNRTAGNLTLGNQGMEVRIAATLTAGIIDITGAHFNLNGATLSAPAGLIQGSSTSDFTVTGTPSSGASISFPISSTTNLRNITIGGNRTMVMPGLNTTNIILYGTLNVQRTSSSVFGTYDNNGESQLQNSGSGVITITGKFITRAATGFVGTSSSIPAISPTLNSGSRIEYARAGDQAIASSGYTGSYYDVELSNSGTKTLSGTADVADSIIISGSTIVTVGANRFGGGAANTTDFKMSGTSSYITAGTGVKPDATKGYNLGSGTTIEFTNSTGTIQEVRLTPSYYNLIVNGTNVGTTGTGDIITHQSGGTFTVKTDKKFKLENTNGFSGAANTAVANTNSPTITLQNSSTVEYSGSNAQAVTGGVSYYSLNIVGSSTRSLAADVTSLDSLRMVAGVLALNGRKLTMNDGHWTAATITGSAASSLTVTGIGGTVQFTGNKTTLKDLELTANADATLADSLDITAGSSAGSVTVLSGADLYTTDKLTLKSDANGTARVSEIPVSGGGAALGNIYDSVMVERYYQPHRAWRCVSVPVQTGYKINEAWQEGGLVANQGDYSNPKPGFGTHITGPAGAYIPGLGFDHNIQNNPSLRYWDGTSSWVTVPNTLTTGITDYSAYMLFVRGSRDNDLMQALNAPEDPTVIRTKGLLNLGDQSAIAGGAAAKVVIANPYASAFNFNRITASGLQGINAYKVWDPLLGGSNNVGNWTDLTIFDDADPTSGYFPSITPASPIDLDSGRVESGAAVMVIMGGGGGSVTVKEVDKDAPSSLVFRPVGVLKKPQHDFLRVELLAKNSDNTISVNDGTAILYKNNFNNAVNDADIEKLPGFSENLSIKRAAKLLAIERRHMITTDDTVFLNIANMRAKDYRFRIYLDGLVDSYTAAYVEDTLLHTKTPINLSDTSLYDFTIAAGLAPAGRFRILFRGNSVILPVTISSLKATELNKDIAVEWKVENELNIQSYEVEKSTDGVTFMKVATVQSGNTLYNWLDVNAVEGANYYRIRSISQTGEVLYSRIVKVDIGKKIPSISIYPNVIENGVTGLQLTNMPKGKYSIRVINSSGQVVFTKQLTHIGGTATETLRLDNVVVKGIYQLEVIQPDKTKTTLKVLNK